MKYLYLFLIMLLTSCGGSSEEFAESVPKNIQGVWFKACDVSGFNSGALLTTQRSIVEFTKISYITTHKIFDENNCTGKMVSELSSEGMYSFVERVVSSDGLVATAAKATNLESGKEVLFSFYSNEGLLYFGSYIGQSSQGVFIDLFSPYFKQ